MVVKLSSLFSCSRAGSALLILAAIAFASSPAHGATKLTTCQSRVKSQIFDYLQEHRAVVDYELTCSRRKTKLAVKGDNKLILDGTVVKARGKKVGNILHVDLSSDKNNLQILSAEPAPLAGSRTAIIIRINSSDGSVPCNESQLSAYMWTNSVNVSQTYNVASYGNVSFRPDGDGNGIADVVTVSIPYATAGKCDYSTWGSAAQTEAAKLVNVGGFQHRMFVLPSNVNCGWAGLASVGGGYSYYHGGHCTWQPELFQHELGHNLGFHHSGTASGEYTDHSCGMGNPGGPVTFNAAKRTEQNWIPSASIAGAVGSYTLKNLLLAPAPGEISAIKLPKGTSENYFVAYRQKGLPEEGGLGASYEQKVTVTRSRGLGSISNLDAILSTGQSFTDSSSGLSIIVDSINPAAQTAAVRVAGNCTASLPTAALSPSLQASNDGSARSYTFTVSNRDSSFCPSSTFSLAAQLPAGWQIAGLPASATVAAGSYTNIAVTVSPAAGSTEATYPFVITASRADGSVAATANYVIDLTAPTAPTGVTAAPQKQGKKVIGYNVTCSGSADSGSGLNGHKMYRDNVLACSAAGSTCLDGITTPGTYVYRCSSLDKAGNESPLSSASATVIIGGKTPRR